MPSAESGCRPEQLIAYADAMARVNADLLGQADHLARQIDRLLSSCREVPLAIDPRLADPLARLARVAGERDEWVRGVANEFMCADQGVSLRDSQLALANERETGAQQELNLVATVIDQSPLSDSDTAQQNWQAWLHLWQARQLRAETLGGAVTELEDELRRTEATYQVAVLTHQPADQLAALQQRISDLRGQLAGDLAAATRVQALLSERDALLLSQGHRQGLGFLLNLVPGGIPAPVTDALLAERLAAIEREIAELTPLVGLRTRRDWADADLGAAAAGLEQAEQRLIDVTTRYYSDITLQAPIQREYLAMLKGKIDSYYPPGSPAYQALLDLEAVLENPDSALFFQRYTAFAELLESDDTLSIIVGNDYRLGAFGNDTRLAVEVGRLAFAEQLKESPFQRGIEDLVMNVVFLGIPSLARNTSVLGHAGISPEVRGQYQVGLGMDIVGILTMLAGPLSKAMGLVRSEGAVLELTDEGIAKLRAAGYSDEVIQTLQTRLASSESADLVKVLGPSTPEEMQAALVRMRVPTPETVYEEILKEWTKKLERPLSDAEVAMLRQEVEFNDALLPRVFQDAPRNPAIHRYADKAVDQYPILYQNILIESMDMHSVLPLRSRPPGAYLYDGLLPPKDMHVSDSMVLFKYADGRRIITRNGQLETVLSDIDVGDYVVRKQWVRDGTFTRPGGFMDRANAGFEAANVQHGPLVRGLTMDDVIHKLGQYDPATGTYLKQERIVDFFRREKVLVFKKNNEFVGFVDEMPLLQYLERYNKAGLKALEDFLPPKIWRDINPGQ